MHDYQLHGIYCIAYIRLSTTTTKNKANTYIMINKGHHFLFFKFPYFVLSEVYKSMSFLKLKYDNRRQNFNKIDLKVEDTKVKQLLVLRTKYRCFNSMCR